jgi:hypothetical protein
MGIFNGTTRAALAVPLTIIAMAAPAKSDQIADHAVVTQSAPNASGDPLNGPRCQHPTAQSWIESRPRWTPGEIWRLRASQSSLETLLFRHGARIDRPYGECQLRSR